MFVQIYIFLIKRVILQELLGELVEAIRKVENYLRMRWIPFWWTKVYLFRTFSIMI